jgi:hypothetical protein
MPYRQLRPVRPVRDFIKKFPALSVLLLICAGCLVGCSQDDSHMKMTIRPETPAETTARVADQHGSEFNHHVAGFILVFAGLTILLEYPLANRAPFLKYIWPSCFLVGGTLLLIFSDAEVWPMGSQSWWYAFGHNPEAIQHKVFSFILLILGAVELERARGHLKAMWAGLIFPFAALAGTVLLLFHVHGGSMTDVGAMNRMYHIQSEHGWFAATGFGIVVTRSLAVIPLKWQPAFQRVWPALLVVLGCLLMVYTE